MSGVKGRSGGARKGAGMPKGKNVKSSDEKKYQQFSRKLSNEFFEILDNYKNKSEFIERAVRITRNIDLLPATEQKKIWEIFKNNPSI